MAFVRCDEDRTWTAEEGIRRCPQVIQAATTDTPYVMMDWSRVLAQDVTITAVTWTEPDVKAITISDESVSGDGKLVSCKIAGFATGDFTLRATVTLSVGTTQTTSKDGILKAV